MPKQTKFIRTQIRIPPELNDSIESFASDQGLSKNETMLFLILKGLEMAKAQKSVNADQPYFTLINQAIDDYNKSKVKDI